MSLIRRAADMLVLHFGKVQPHHSGVGTVGEHAFHVQCPWRIDGPAGTLTGSHDLFVYAGEGNEPPNWSYDDGFSLQDKRLDALFGPRDSIRAWNNETPFFEVIAVEHTGLGDMKVSFSGSYKLLVFPDGSVGEAWRFLAPHGGSHQVFPALD